MSFGLIYCHFSLVVSLPKPPLSHPSPSPPSPLHILSLPDSLHYSSAISVLLAIVFVLITLVLTIVRLANGQVAAPRWVPNFSSGQAVAAFFSVIPVRDME